MLPEDMKESQIKLFEWFRPCINYGEVQFFFLKEKLQCVWLTQLDLQRTCEYGSIRRIESLCSMLLCIPLSKSEAVLGAESCLLWMVNNKYLLMTNIRRAGKASLSLENRTIQPTDKMCAISPGLQRREKNRRDLAVLYDCLTVLSLTSQQLFMLLPNCLNGKCSNYHLKFIFTGLQIWGLSHFWQFLHFFMLVQYIIFDFSVSWDFTFSRYVNEDRDIYLKT